VLLSLTLALRTRACVVVPAPGLQLAGGDLAALSREVLGAADPDISRAAGGGYGATEDEESESGEAGQHMARGGLQQQQRQRRGRLPEADYRDGAGI
jgi:hypothetical protein